MRKLMVIGLLGTMLLCFNWGIASADLINTGTAPIGGANYAVASWEFLAGEFTLTEKTTITSIEGWMHINDGGNLVAAIYTGAGTVPGSMLYSSPFAVAAEPYPQTAWRGVMGLNWVLEPGTYWVSFEGTGSAWATMWRDSEHPLEHEAFWSSSNGYWIGYYHLGMGVRINHSVVPIPGSFLILSSGLLGLAGWRRFRKN